MIRYALPLLLATAATAQQPPAATLNQQRPTPLVCAHRGWLSVHEVENSVNVMRHTYQSGVPMVEFDLSESKDGEIYLLHDKLLDRTTNRTGPLANLTSTELQSVKINNPDTHAPVEPINTFEDLLTWAQHNAVFLMVDLKATPASDAVAALKRHHLLDRAVLLTFDPGTAAAALASDPSVLVSVLVKTPEEMQADLIQANGHPLALYLPQTGTPELFRLAHQTGHVVITDLMNGIDDQASRDGDSAYREYLSRHPADIFVTNHAAMLLQEIRSRQTSTNP